MDGKRTRPRVWCSAPSRHAGGVDNAHHLVTALRLTLTGEGAGQHTRRRVCASKGTASLRLKAGRQQIGAPNQKTLDLPRTNNKRLLILPRLCTTKPIPWKPTGRRNTSKPSAH